MTALLRLDRSAVHLGDKVAEGGEGRICRIRGTKDLLAKIYHRPVNETLHRKLQAIVRMGTPSLQLAAAWPVDLLTDGRALCVGILMPCIHAPGDIDQLSHPAEQRLVFPTVDYRFLLHVSLNLMRAAATIHAAGCVIGDINQSNVRILSDGTVRFTDVDSFQVRANGEVFTCDVGTPMYTPPELQTVAFRSCTRTANHDAFGLAVLAFQLLMCGRHPFAGVPRNTPTARTIEDAISTHLYAYSPHNIARIAPPPDTLPISALGNLAAVFERAFTNCDRPTAMEWVHELEIARGGLRKCDRNPRHGIFGNGPCALCGLRRDPLPPTVLQLQERGDLSIEQLLREVNKLQPLRAVLERCAQPELTDEERRIALPKQGFDTGAIGRWLIGAGIAGFLVCPFEMQTRFGILIVGVGAAGALRLIAKLEAMASSGGATPRHVLLNTAIQQALSVERQVLVVERETKPRLDAVWHTIAEQRNYLLGHHHRLQEDLAGAEDSYEKHLLIEFLRRRFVAKASIRGIGPSRVSMLASFGIETAADIHSRMRRIPTIGPKLRKRLMEWRASCARAFPGIPASGVPEHWRDQIRRRRNSEGLAACSKLQGAINEYRSRFNWADCSLADAAKQLDQARSACRQEIARIMRS